MIRKWLWVKLLLLFCMLLCSTAVAEAPQHTIKMFNEETFTDEQEKFYPSDKIYAVTDFTNIQKGKYELNIDWILPTGKLVKQDSHTLTLPEDAGGYRVYFWLQLHEKGAIKQIFTGGEYNEVVYGRWKVQIYCNGEPLSQAWFEITDSVI